jgi:hypothetical protein
VSTKTVLMTGNPVDGFVFVGPFDNHESACDFAEACGHDLERDWWTADLADPTDPETVI